MTFHLIIGYVDMEPNMQQANASNKRKALHHIFERQVRKHPNNIAVSHGDQNISYYDLNLAAERLAKIITRKTAGNFLVGVCMQRGIDFFIAIIAVLKAGGAYIPFDPSDPIERIKVILENDEPQIILTNVDDKGFSMFGDRRINIHSVNEYEEQRLNACADLPRVPVDKPAYVVYTSGSAGKPKGVIVTHSNVVNYLEWFVDFVGLDQCDVFDFSSPISFDFSITATLAPLVCGACVSICEASVKMAPSKFLEYLVASKITYLKLTPGYFSSLLQYAHIIEKLDNLKMVVLGGEPVLYKDIERWLSLRPDHKILNEYGPTETTVAALAHIITADNLDDYDGLIPIGMSISNAKLYVVNENNKLCDDGERGDLWIYGHGVSLGYLNSDELTKQRFVPNPFDRSGVAYKTGDCVSRLSDGNHFFHGRLDEQVKIMGYRVEPSEVEYCLEKMPVIKQAVVLKTKVDGLLTAYIVCSKKIILSPHDIRLFLMNYLPDYMLPARYVVLQSIPLKISGKIDKTSLADLKYDYSFRTNVYVAPKSHEELALVRAWSRVLNIPKNYIGINDDFFDLGGNSLAAIYIIGEINQEFSSDVTVEAVFANPTIAVLARGILKKSGGQKMCDITSYDKDIYPLSYPQELIWFHQQSFPDVPFYNEPVTINISMSLDVVLFERALDVLVQQHDVLRTRIFVKDGESYQKFVSHSDLSLKVIDLSDLRDRERTEELQKITKKIAGIPFSFGEEALFRFVLLRVGFEKYKLVIVAHHCVIDAVTIYHVLIPQLEKLYIDGLNAKPLVISENVLQYKDYACWQRDNLLGLSGMSDHRKYWCEQLKNIESVAFPYSKRVNNAVSCRGKMKYLTLDGDVVYKLRAIVKECNVTLYTYLLTVFQVLIYRYTLQSDIVTATVVSGRDQHEFSNTAGNFLNTILLRTKINDRDSFIDLLRRVQENNVEALSHRQFPFQEVLKCLKQDYGYNDLAFQLAFIFEPHTVASELGWEISQLEMHTDTAKTDLMFEIDERGDKIYGRIEYSASLFEDWFIDQLICHYQRIISSSLDDLDESLGLLSMLTPEEETVLLKRRLLKDPKEYQNNLIYQLFAIQAENSLDYVAIEYSDGLITYGELENKVNVFARNLLKDGVKSGDIVAFCMPRSWKVVVAMLAIMKCGCAYLCIDDKLPQKRVGYILGNANPSTIIVDSKCVDIFRPNPERVIVYDDLVVRDTAESNVIFPSVSGNDLAYVMYTSGSTGFPKGVMIEHGGLVNMIKAQINKFNITPNDKVLGFASFSFDASVSEIFTALLSGACYYILDNCVVDPINLSRVINENQISIATLSPSILSLLPMDIDYPNLKTLVSAGEVCTDELRDRWINKTTFINAYGPTEATVCTTTEIFRGNVASTSIGMPIDNVSVYVLDANQQPVPFGVIGELYIGGAGLARGYLNDEALTKKFFVDNPFESSGRLYRTGDLVKRDPEGRIVFVSRVDDQVKVRGYRIELPEVERCLLKYDYVKRAKVIVKTDSVGICFLVAYVELNSGAEFNREKLRGHCLLWLPNYMVPTQIIALDSFPMTINGKIDRCALSAFVGCDRRVSLENRPRTRVQEKLVEVWRQILEVGNIHIYENFFELGGHSLSVLRLISRIKRMFNVDLNVHHVCESPTIAELSEKIKEFVVDDEDMSMRAELTDD